MIADSFFQQGVTHDVCQDYATNGEEKYAVISDGCSNGGGEDIETDWGARVLTKTAEEFLYALADTGVISPGDFAPDVMKESSARTQQFFLLEPMCLIATLGVVLSCKNDKSLGTFIMGDGVEGARRRDGKWEFKVYEAKRGGCFYPYYLLHEDDLGFYFNKFEGTYTITTYIGDLSKPSEMTVSQQDAVLTKDKLHFASEYPTDEYDVAFVGSDGLSSFFKKVNTGTSKHNEPVPVSEVLSVLFDIQTYRPDFMKLQRKWAFKRSLPGTFVRRDWHNSDDVAMGVVYAGDHQQ